MSYISLDLNKDIVNNDKVKKVIIALKDLYKITQFKNLEYLIVNNSYGDEADDETFCNENKVINFGIFPNLTKLVLEIYSNISIEKILLTNLVKLKELEIKALPKLKERIDLKDCINLRKLSVMDFCYILYNQPNIKILNISKYDGNECVDLSQLINLKELSYSLMNGSCYIDLSKQTKLIKLNTFNCYVKGINKNLKYLSIAGSIFYIDNQKFAPIDEIQKMTKLKFLNITYTSGFEDYYTFISCEEVDLINLKELEVLKSVGGYIIKNINNKIKKISIITYDIFYDQYVTLVKNDKEFINYDITTYNNLNEMKKLRYLELHNFSTKELNINKCTNLKTLKLSNLNQLDKIYFSYNYSGKFISNMLNSLKNMILTRRRIYLLSESGEDTWNRLTELKGPSQGPSQDKIICKKCNRRVDLNNIVNFYKNKSLYANTCC